MCGPSCCTAAAAPPRGPTGRPCATTPRAATGSTPSSARCGRFTTTPSARAPPPPPPCSPNPLFPARLPAPPSAHRWRLCPAHTPDRPPDQLQPQAMTNACSTLPKRACVPPLPSRPRSSDRTPLPNPDPRAGLTRPAALCTASQAASTPMHASPRHRLVMNRRWQTGCRQHSNASCACVHLIRRLSCKRMEDVFAHHPARTPRVSFHREQRTPTAPPHALCVLPQ